MGQRTGQGRQPVWAPVFHRLPHLAGGMEPADSHRLSRAHQLGRVVRTAVRMPGAAAPLALSDAAACAPHCQAAAEHSHCSGPGAAEV